jgi:hypothetical protein
MTTRFPNVNHLIKRVNVNLPGSSLTDSRKRRREPFKLNTEIEDDDINEEEQSQQTLPFALRGTGGSSVPNPFTASMEREEPYVYMPKRKKLSMFPRNDASNH